MAEACPHCGAALPPVRDAFCSECGNDLDEAPATSLPRREPDGGRSNAEGRPGDVWYATEERIFRLMKWSWYDDRGSLDASPRGLCFAGQRGTRTLRPVSAVRLIGPVVPWGSVAGLLVGDVAVLLLSWAGAFNFLTLDNPVTYVLLGVLNL
ncbi:MAG TPA: zinc ribbon domain-containing protein, partial [Gemmataceae bacterium]|nr:zinc ribbon domain-containing protein [Gemmataceae bacterium]